MADQDIFAKYGGTALAQGTNQTPVSEPVSQSPTTNDDVFAKYGGSSVSEEPKTTTQTPQVSNSSSTQDVFAKYGGSSSEPVTSSLSGLQPEVIHHNIEPSNADDPWYKKAWDFANAPLFDEDTARSWFGADPEHWSGWGKGAFDLLSGLTSPLQLALTLGTLGTSALESLGVKAGITGGEAALKGLLSAEDIGEVVKGSKILSDSIKLGYSPEIAYKAIAESGINADVVKGGLDKLASLGLNPESLLADGIIRKTGGALLRNAGVDAASADKIANWTEFAINGGFTAQTAYGAAIAAPRVLDAIKEGDYESAKRYAVDAVGSGIFAVLGATAAHQHAGELLSDTEASLGLRVKPSDENVKIQKILEPVERERVLSGEKEKAWEESTEKQFPEFANKDDKWIAGGANESDLRARFFRESGSFIPAKSNNISIDSILENHDRIKEHSFREEPNEKLFHFQDDNLHELNSQVNRFIQENNASQDPFVKASSEHIQTAFNEADRLGFLENTPDINKAISSQDDALNRIHVLINYLKKNVTPKAELDGLENLRSWHDAIAESAGRAGDKLKSNSEWPPDIQNFIDRVKLKDKPKEYVDQLLKATNPDSLTDKEIEYAKHTGAHFDETGAKALSEEALKGLADSYVTRVFKSPEESETIKQFRATTSNPDFSVNTSMARKRIFQTTLEGILNGHELEDHSLSSLAGYNAREFARISSNRQALSRLRGAAAKASDGRPLVALSGSGHVVESYDANGNPVNPATIINPRAMQNIRMADKVVQGLKDNVIRNGDEGKYAYRLRDVGEQGVNPEGHAQLTTRFEDTARWRDSRSENPQEVVRIPLDKLSPGDYESKPGPNGGNWLSLKRSLEESELEKLADNHKPAETVTELDKLIKEGRIVKYGQTKSRNKSPIKEKYIYEPNPVKAPPGKLSFVNNELSADWNKYSIVDDSGKVLAIGRDSQLAAQRLSSEDFHKLDRKIIQREYTKKVDSKYEQEPFVPKDLYAWKPNDYLTVDHPAFRDWKVPTTDTQGNPVFVQGELKAHPEAHEYLSRLFGPREDTIQNIPGVKTALALSREAKGFLLAFSPFHAVQEGLRAVMTGISPIGSERFNPDNPLHVLAAQKGVWSTKDYKGIRNFEDGLSGHSKVISKIPIARDVQNWLETSLFDRYIPGLKLRSFENLYNRYKEAYPDWTKDKVANKAAEDTNNRFGGIDYKRMGRSAATMDAARLVTLAPDWLESELRFMGSMFGQEGKIARRDVIKTAVVLWGAARVLNYLSTGEAHNEAPFGVAFKDDQGQEKVYSLRTVPTDMLHAVSDPLGFMNGRIAPLVKTGIQTYTGRDEQGRKLDRNGIFVNLLRNVTPIGLQAGIKQATGQNPDITSTDSVARAAGLTVTPYRTEAEKLAAKIASDRSPQGPVDPSKLRRHQALLKLEQDLREGKANVQDLNKAIDSGQLHPKEAKEAIKNLKETEGLDPASARMYSHAQRAPMTDMIKIFEAGTSSEKTMLIKLLIKKKTAYIKQFMKDASPAERASDPTYQWIRKHFPQDASF